MDEPIYFVADIGGTNARFAVADAAFNFQKIIVVPTQSLADGQAFADRARAALGIEQFAAGCVAVAGPLRQGAVRITNGQLHLSETALSRDFACPMHLVNDFYGLAHGVPSFERLVQIGGVADQAGVKAILGAGSGLGMSALVPLPANPAASSWLVLASEGGYADLPCSTELETAVVECLQRQHQHLCWETVLSGPGLVNLYHGLAEVWGYPIEKEVTAEWISEQGVDAQVPLCHQTLEMFFGFLGAAAGNLAVTFYATGGVYIAGGIVPKLDTFARSSSLRRRFDERGPLASFAQTVPVYLVHDEYPGLLGAAVLLRQRLS